MQVVTDNPFNSQVKMFKHSNKLNQYKVSGSTDSPILIEVNLTDRCPLSCKWCISSYSAKNNNVIKTDKLKQFLKEYVEAGGKSVTWSGGGEPTQHPDFCSILNYAKKLGLDQGLMTCGLYPKEYNRTIETCCKWVRYSLDTNDRQHYLDIKGVNAVEKVIDVISDINKSVIKVGINMNMPQEPNQMIEALSLMDLASELKVDYLQVRPVLPRFYNKEKVNREILSEQISYLKIIDGVKYGNTELRISWDKFNDLMKTDYGKTYDICEGHQFECVLNSNGDLCVCMYLLNDPDFVFGNIYNQSFNDIWNSSKRVSMLKNLNLNKCQVCCKCHEINKLISYINNNDDEVNFI